MPTREATDEELLASVFEERAEFLSRRELREWTAETPHDRQILAKLTGPGAKLLIGPRGSGKSTFLRRAYFDLLDSGSVLPVYVNYAKSLALEPLFHRSANALQLFRQWVLLKIVLGVAEAMTGRELPLTLVELREIADERVRELETGQEPRRLQGMLAPSQTLELLEEWTNFFGRRRLVLLFDDAAHAFSPEQQREFFEIFRELRSRVVSAKAAVYPGITSYTPHFHVGHEAELVEAWFRPDDPDYLSTFRQIVERRLPPALSNRLRGREELIDYLGLASFGLPRGFLVMLSQLLGVEEDETHRPNRAIADSAIAAHASSVREIFNALALKLPRYRHFVELGQDLDRAVLSLLQRFNRTRSVGQKAVIVGLAESIEPELRRTLSFLEYAGIMRKLDAVSRGVKGVFQRYMIHYALLLSENALALGKSPAVSAAIDALLQRDAHAFVRTRGVSLLGPDFRSRCTIDLAPCQVCGARRVSEDARFCMNCGSKLTETSIYEELLKAPIERLPLTEHKLKGLITRTSIRTVQDILLDEESREVRSVPYVGPVWAARIRRYAEEFVYV